MIASKKIIEKFSNHCSDDEKLKNFLIDLFDFEMKETGWYTEEYDKLIKKYVLKGGTNENS